MRRKIGESLVQAGLISEDDLQAALVEHRRSGDRVGAALVKLNLATEKQIAKALAYQLGFPYINPAEHPPEPAAVVLIPKNMALDRVCVVVKAEQHQLTLAMADPLLFGVVQDLEFQTGFRIKQVVATKTDIETAIHAGYPDRALAPIDDQTGPSALAVPQRAAGDGGADSDEALALLRAEDGSLLADDATDEDRGDRSPIVDLVDLIVTSAVTKSASDIHIEATEKRVVVRHRLDGILREVMDLPKWANEGLVARVKLLAGMDIAEKRRPQDGRLRMQVDDDQDIDLRVSSLRTLHGEKLVLRVLDQRKGPPLLTELGFPESGLVAMHRFLRRPHGMILVVGPTGSGKTTTLSSAIASIQSTRTNITTIEDPIEYELQGVNQTQVNHKIDLSFASSLRAILRQDPDVIFVGEIRDHETAQIALRAAQTGHLVLSTLHTDDGPSTVTRLMDIGIEPYVISSALIGVVAQRLVRRLCVHCRLQYTPTPDELRALNIPEADADTYTFCRPVGCDECDQTGYRGRIGIYEFMTVNGRLRRVIASNGGEDAIRDEAKVAGMSNMAADGLAKVRSGLTTADELLRVVPEMRALQLLCPDCDGVVEGDFQVCPHCGQRLSRGCPSCHRTLQPGWRFCPDCTTHVAASTTRTRIAASTKQKRIAASKSNTGTAVSTKQKRIAASKSKTSTAVSTKQKRVAASKTKTSIVAVKKRGPRKAAAPDQPALPIASATDVEAVQAADPSAASGSMRSS